ncbi:hypothetical protein [Arthrobacter sp. PAMC 25486]|uniref:hypothetical protein n=1 Tax=Arthrobacter sp. PAMC 25486 TaxID=1494608 RepID=UPI0012FF142E|nr:hypothetical protein [Arthrobacter sp. PAMC 25486]
MGLKEWAAKAPVAMYGDFILRKGGIEKVGGGLRKDARGLAGVTAVVDSGEALSQRVTLTRLVAVGIFAFAIPKKSGGGSFLLIEGPDFAWQVEVDRGGQAKARDFAMKVNTQARIAS